MHDPMVVAHTIRRPWPRNKPFRYWPVLVTIWHVEPDGRDALTVCTRRWKWHIHHWKVQVHALQQLRRWALTRCEVCGGKSRKGRYVNVSRHWHRAKDPWWRGERGLYHADCYTTEREGANAA